MKPKLNPHNFKQLDELKKKIDSLYPGRLAGFYLKDYTSSSMALTPMAISATFESDGPSLVWRIYRKSDTPEKNAWDVDQINSVNKEVMYIPKKSEITDHHINHSIEQDIMRRNEMLFEVVQDKEGNFVINTNDNGLAPCIINFEEVPTRDGRDPQSRYPYLLT